jgi:hypothetical protein
MVTSKQASASPRHSSRVDRAEDGPLEQSERHVDRGKADEPVAQARDLHDRHARAGEEQQEEEGLAQQQEVQEGVDDSSVVQQGAAADHQEKGAEPEHELPRQVAPAAGQHEHDHWSNHREMGEVEHGRCSDRREQTREHGAREQQEAQQARVHERGPAVAREAGPGIALVEATREQARAHGVLSRISCEPRAPGSCERDASAAA